jgi:hypothetical protein
VLAFRSWRWTAGTAQEHAQAPGCAGPGGVGARGEQPGEPSITSGVHRCYGWVARRHVAAAGLAALPMALAARAAAAVAWNRPADAITVGRTDLVLVLVSVIFLVVGVTAWGLIEHLMVHWRATHARAQAGLGGRWFADQYGRWWYQP